MTVQEVWLRVATKGSEAAPIPIWLCSGLWGGGPNTLCIPRSLATAMSQDKLVSLLSGAVKLSTWLLKAGSCSHPNPSQCPGKEPWRSGAEHAGTALAQSCWLWNLCYPRRSHQPALLTEGSPTEWKQTFTRVAGSGRSDHLPVRAEIAGITQT